MPISAIELPSRRDFLVRSGQSISALLTPAGFWKLAYAAGPASQSASTPDFHLHPHYRAQLPLDTVLAKVEPGSDQFTSEKYANQIAAIFAKWSLTLRASPPSFDEIERSFAEDFVGTSFMPARSETLRAGIIDVWNDKFHPGTLSSQDFAHHLRARFAGFSRVLTADFQITRIEVGLPRVKTRVYYEVVGTGNNYHREQRIGEWDIEWEQPASDQFRVKHWAIVGETRSRATRPVFSDISTSAFGSTLSYKDQLSHGSDYWRTLLDGACGIDVYGHNGVSAGDIDNDGFDDVYICQPAGLPNRLFRNRGDGTFEDITESAGVGVLDNTSCALFVDINNDGLQDLIVVRTSGPWLFLNQGNDKFRLKPDAFQFATVPQGTFTGASAADYDRDGWVDIYFCLYNYYQGAGQYRYPLPYYDANNGPPNFMMRNNRDATFRDVTAETGLSQNNTRYSFCCGWNDFNNDGWPDLYVVNDFGRKNLYRNNGNRTFTDVAADLGVDDVGAGMSVCWFDYDNDGSEDLYVANMWTAAGERISTQQVFQKDSPPNIRALYQKHAMGNSLLHNGRNKFADLTSSAGVAIGRWAWSSDAWDFDHDGFLDLYVANGMVSGPSQAELNSFFWRQTVANSPDQPKPSPDYEQGWNAINELIRSDGTWSGYERNLLYANNGNGRFHDVSGAAGLDFIEDGRSFALADFDHDGRQELLLKNRNAPQLRLIKNALPELPPSISFRLRGTGSNRDAIGAVVTLKAGGGHQQVRCLQAGSGFLSQHSKEIFFGLGDATGPINASIRWPSGLLQEFKDLPLNHRVTVEEGSPSIKADPFASYRPPADSHQTSPAAHSPGAEDLRAPEVLPDSVETWLLTPIAAPDFSLPDSNGNARSLSSFRGKPVLLNFWTSESQPCLDLLTSFGPVYQKWLNANLQLVTVNVGPAQQPGNLRKNNFSFPVLSASDDVSAIYNIVHRYLFDRHRDLPVPASFLIDSNGEIVKLYQGRTNIEHISNDYLNIPETSSARLSVALPFPGVTEDTEFQRNYLSYGSIFFQRGYYDESAAAFEHAIRDNPESAEAYYGLGSVYLQQGKTAEAKQNFERVTKSQPINPGTLPDAWNNLGLLAAREGRTADAIPYFQQALQLSPDHLVALKNLGNAYRDEKQWDDARAALEQAVKVGPDDPEAHYALGMVYAQLGDADRALEYLQKALKLRPSYPEALNNLGVIYIRSNRRDEAVASFEECIRVAPAFDQAYLNLARVYVIENSPEKARAVLLELLKQHPDHAMAKNMLDRLGGQ